MKSQSSADIQIQDLGNEVMCDKQMNWPRSESSTFRVWWTNSILTPRNRSDKESHIILVHFGVEWVHTFQQWQGGFSPYTEKEKKPIEAINHFSVLKNGRIPIWGLRARDFLLVGSNWRPFSHKHKQKINSTYRFFNNLMWPWFFMMLGHKPFILCHHGWGLNIFPLLMFSCSIDVDSK